MTRIEELHKEIRTNLDYKIALLNTRLYKENHDLDTTEIDAEIEEVRAEIRAMRVELRTLLTH